MVYTVTHRKPRPDDLRGVLLFSTLHFAMPPDSSHAMPAYQNVTSLFSGDVGFSFNNEAFPASATSGTQFALPSFTGTNDPGTAVRWQTIFGTAPTAVNIVLQGAMADVDAE